MDEKLLLDVGWMRTKKKGVKFYRYKMSSAFDIGTQRTQEEKGLRKEGERRRYRCMHFSKGGKRRGIIQAESSSLLKGVHEQAD